MGIKEDIEKIVAKYKLKRHIFIGCAGDKHHAHFFGEKKNLIKMLEQMREAIEHYFAVKEN